MAETNPLPLTCDGRAVGAAFAAAWGFLTVTHITAMVVCRGTHIPRVVASTTRIPTGAR